MATTTSQVLAALTQANALWRAADTSVSRLSDPERRRLLGAVPGAAALARMAAPQAAATSPAFAPAIDWRSHNGNHITPVKDQGGCGSCVSFGTCGLLEAMTHIECGQMVDLSEADSHFCSNHGANCGGWWPDDCLNQVLGRGLCDEATFPYPSAFPGNDIWKDPPQCHVASNRAQHTFKIAGQIALNDATAVKNYLSTTGPVTGCFTVYDDFFHYSSGVYHHTTGGVAGGHCVLVIGYSEADQCWICKNSWNTGWGEGGFFKIAYADFLYGGQFFAMHGAHGIVLPAAGWQPMGGKITTPPAAGSNKDGRIEVFARGTDNALWHIWQTAP